MDDNLNDNKIESISALRKEVVKRFFYIIVAIVVLVVVAMAWFVSNNSVKASGATISGDAKGFDLATEGDSSYYRDGIKTGEEYTITIEDTTKTLYKTKDGNTIQWMVGQDSNLHNKENNLLSPGSSGKISFWILPIEDTEKVVINLNTIGYKVDETGETVVKYSDDFSEKVSVYSGNDYLQGHIMFFTGYDGNYYSGLLNDYSDSEDKFKELEIDFTENKTPREITLYWIWPLQFTNLLKCNINDKTVCEDNSDDYNTIKAGIISKPESFLYYDDNESPNTNIDIFDNMTATLIETFKSRYNRADESIGENLTYLLLELVAK